MVKSKRGGSNNQQKLLSNLAPKQFFGRIGNSYVNF